MQSIIKAMLAAAAAGVFAGDALAQSQGPLTTLPWASRSRAKPNPEPQNVQQPTESTNQLTVGPPASAAPVQAAPPEPPKEKTADR